MGWCLFSVCLIVVSLIIVVFVCVLVWFVDGDKFVCFEYG